MKANTKVKASILGAAALATLCGCSAKQESHSVVVYYSATGTTETVAKLIHEKTGADLLKIEPVESYGEDYDGIIKAFQQEMEQGNIREIEPTGLKVSDYDTVYVGTPVWFGRCAGPVEVFLRESDLKGKVVVPFCTFGSGGNTVPGQMKTLQPEASFTDWFGIRAARIDKADAEVTAFLAKIGAIEGDVSEWPDFSENRTPDEAEMAIFNEACGSYPMPLGTPDRVASRDKGDSIEYLFKGTVNGRDGKETTQSIYVTKGKSEGSVAEFTQVVR